MPPCRPALLRRIDRRAIPGAFRRGLRIHRHQPSTILSSADAKTFKAVPESNLETAFATAVIPCNDFQLFGLEAAMIDGPWLVQSEYVSTLMSPLTGKEIYMPSTIWKPPTFSRERITTTTGPGNSSAA